MVLDFGGAVDPGEMVGQGICFNHAPYEEERDQRVKKAWQPESSGSPGPGFV